MSRRLATLRADARVVPLTPAEPDLPGWPLALVVAVSVALLLGGVVLGLVAALGWLLR